MHILVVGGTGFIGSHTVVELINSGHSVVVLDNLSNSSPIVLDRVAELTGETVPFFKVDLRDREGLQHVFASQSFDCCFHFAGLKAVGESVLKPWIYYDNNVTGTLTLLDVMRQNGLKDIVFSSTATVYGDPEFVPVTEQHPKGICTNPYAQTKTMIEDILIALHTADVQNGDEKPWNIVLLRYANPIGAHPSGRIGEDPLGIPNNLMPYITQVAVGKREKLTVFGNDYDTPDGTGVRDYIHVVDLARGHVDALKIFEIRGGETQSDDTRGSKTQNDELQCAAIRKSELQDDVTRSCVTRCGELRKGITQSDETQCSEPRSAEAQDVTNRGGVEIFNLSTGRGYSVLDIVQTFERVNQVNIPYEIGPRRPGDIATSYLSPARANEVLGWKATHNIEDMCRDSWNWQKNNPEGYV
ncbi:MAG: UDP-glucose 4-epimerase GalE [Saccharofermentanales bacterium]|jgi:UDP-glucose 4-epimerase